MILDELTWPEIEALDRGSILPVCVLAATEQHSLHLPLATDRLIGNEILRRAERRLPETLLVLPSVAVGCSAHHLGFAGSLSIRHTTMLATIEDLARSVSRHGFRKLLLINSHGGNHAAMVVAIQQMLETLPEMAVAGASYWSLAAQALSELRESDLGGMGHACELETSILLRIRPDLVRMGRAERDGDYSPSHFFGHEMLKAAPVATARPFREFTRNGGYGDPTIATADKGEHFLKAIVDAVVDLSLEIIGTPE
ncbi:MAG: creatininase family protein [Bryobacterales bacterium]|nr:creatininase family protein [Bryobacterales bacterium]